jgi:hypothetical protein
MNQLLTCLIISDPTFKSRFLSRTVVRAEKENIPDYGSTLSIQPSMPSPLPLGMDCSHFLETILSAQWWLPSVDCLDVFEEHELQDCLGLVPATHSVVGEHIRLDSGMASGFVHAEARLKDDWLLAVVRMTEIDKVVAFAGCEDRVVAAECVVFEDDLKDVGVDGRSLGNNWEVIALVEAKSVLEDLRQVGSVDRMVERIKIGTAD